VIHGMAISASAMDVATQKELLPTIGRQPYRVPSEYRLLLGISIVLLKIFFD
jgi:hypothetical protein